MKTDDGKDRLILTLLSAWETALHNVDTFREIVQEIPGWEQKFERRHTDFVRNLQTTARFAPVRQAIRELIGGEEATSIIEEAQRQLNRKLN